MMTYFPMIKLFKHRVHHLVNYMPMIMKAEENPSSIAYWIERAYEPVKIRPHYSICLNPLYGSRLTQC